MKTRKSLASFLLGVLRRGTSALADSDNGHGTRILVESVVMQRNLGSNRFRRGQALVPDYSQPNTPGRGVAPLFL